MINPLCNFRREVKFSAHFFQHSFSFLNERRTLLCNSNISRTDTELLENNDSVPKKTLLFGNGSHNLNNNFKIITSSTEYILSTNRFDKPLVWNCTFPPIDFNQNSFLISAMNFLFFFLLRFLMFNFLSFFSVYRYMTMWLKPFDFVFMHLLWGTFWCLIPDECLVFILFMCCVNIYRYKRKQKSKQ